MSPDCHCHITNDAAYIVQKEKIEKLKASLEDAMASHKQTMGDNEKLLADLQKANETIQVWHRHMLPCLAAAAEGFNALVVIGVLSQRLISTCIPAQFLSLTVSLHIQVIYAIMI